MADDKHEQTGEPEQAPHIDPISEQGLPSEDEAKLSPVVPEVPAAGEEQDEPAGVTTPGETAPTAAADVTSDRAESDQEPNTSAPGNAPHDTAVIEKIDPPQAGSEDSRVEPARKAAQPVHVDNRTRRDDNDALEGHFVDIVDGDHSGRRGTFDRVTEYGKDGYPRKILVITRDERNEYLEVPYETARPTSYKGGR